MAAFIKLETSLSTFTNDDPCGLKKAREEDLIEKTASLEDIKQSVTNFTKVNEDMGISKEKTIQAVPIDIRRIKEFLNKNGEDSLDGIRLYFTKESDNPNINDDYKIMMVPCTWNGQHYEDKDITDNKVFLTSAMCKRPPGCPEGAKFLS